jgi:hypothetical protein
MSYNQKHNPINTSIHAIRLIELEIPRRFGGHNTTSYDVEQVLSHCGLLEKMTRKYPLKYSFTTPKELAKYGFEQMSEIYSEKHQEMLDDYDLYVTDFSLYLASGSFTPQDVWHELNGDFKCYGHPFDFDRSVNYATFASMHDSDVSLDLQLPCHFSEKQKCKKNERESALKTKSCKSFLQQCKNGFREVPYTFVKGGHPKKRLSSEVEKSIEIDTQLDRLNKADLKEQIRKSGFNSIRSKTIGRKTMGKKSRYRKLNFDDDFVLTN